MNIVNTLPFRPSLSNFLFLAGLKKRVVIFFIGCLLIFNNSCSKLEQAESIALEVWHGGSKLSCNALKNNQQDWSIEQLAFFISALELSGGETSIKPQLSSTPWQTNDVALMQPNLDDCDTQSKTVDKIDDESKQMSQINSGVRKSNVNVQFTAPVDLASSQQLSFTLAVPFELNHQNPLLQPSPLNLPSMFWSWRSGHKFFRLDMQGPNQSWVFHLGSVGCSAVSTMRSPQQECVQPNRVRFHLDKKHNGAKLVMHLDRLLANTALQNSDSCLFHSEQKSCDILMSNLTTQNVFEWH